MTAPVVTNDPDSNNKMTHMQFILPSKFSPGYDTSDGLHETPPAPENENVKILDRERKVMAVKTFSGYWEDAEFQEKYQEFLVELKANKHIKPQIREPVRWEIYRYNPPWTIAQLRTNEIAIQLVEPYKPMEGGSTGAEPQIYS